MSDVIRKLVGKTTVAGSMGCLVFACSCVILIVSVSDLPAPSALPLNLSMVGQNTALATALMGAALMLSVRGGNGQSPVLLYLLTLVLSGAVIFQRLVNVYPLDGPMRVVLNTLPAVGSWPGRMSHVTALVLILLCASALVSRRRTLFAAMAGAMASGLAAAVSLGSLTAHLAGLTLFPSAVEGGGILSFTTSFLLTLIGFALGYQILNGATYSDWRLRYPGQGVFAEVMILLSLLFVMAMGSAGEFALQGRISLAFGILLCFFLLGLVVIYRPIVMLVNKSVANGIELRAREAALEQAQSQAQLGNWQIQLPDGELEWSRECYRIFGLSPVMPMTFDDFLAAVYPEDREHVRKSWCLALAGERYDIQHRIIVNGAIKWVRERAHLVFDRDDNLVSGIGTVQDITQLKLKETQLRESRDQVRQLAAHSENIREQERTRIARELHDEMGQQLTVLRLDASLIVKRFGQVSPELTDMLTNMKKGIDSSISVMRNVATSLRPLALDAGLVSAVDWLLESLQQRTGIQCSLTVEGVDTGLGAGLTTTAFRVVQESVTNVIRHAEATRLSIRLTINKRELFLGIADNGIGFDAVSVSACSHFGLMGIRERVLIYGGTTTIDTEPGRGTTLSVIIPIDRRVATGGCYQ